MRPIGHINNFCYIVACLETKKTAIIDPGADKDHILNSITYYGDGKLFTGDTIALVF